MQARLSTWTCIYSCEPRADVPQARVDTLANPSGEIRTAIEHEVTVRILLGWCKAVGHGLEETEAVLIQISATSLSRRPAGPVAL